MRRFVRFLIYSDSGKGKSLLAIRNFLKYLARTQHLLLRFQLQQSKDQLMQTTEETSRAQRASAKLTQSDAY